MAKIWKEEDNLFLKENFMKMSNQELAEYFNVSKKAIQGKLRRLGLHRNEVEETPQPVEPEKEEEIQKEEFVLKRKRLNIKIQPPEKKKKVRHEYVKPEETERRKRAIREFNNAVNILASGDRDRATKEFEFIIKKFNSELDIIQRSQVYLRLCKAKDNQNDIPEPKTAEEHYLLGIWYYQNMDLEKARQLFEKASQLDPDYIDPVYNIACLDCRAGNLDAAMDKLEILFQKNDRLVNIAINDEDFTELLENQRFIEMVKPYL